MQVLNKSPKRIIHCTNFNYVKRIGAFMNLAPYKISNGLIRNGNYVLDFSDRDLNKVFSVFGKLKQLGNKAFNDLFYQYCVDVNPDALIIAHIDLIAPKTLEAVKKALPNMKILEWNVDCINPKIVPSNIKNIKSRIDLVDYTLITTADKELLRQFDTKKNKVGFIPNPVDASIENGRAFELENPEYDFVFPASPKSVREFGDKLMVTSDIIARITQNIDMNKVLFSRAIGKAIIGDEYNRVMANSAMGLCLNRSSHDYLYSSDRMAHLMGNGSLAIIDEHSGFGDIFSKDEMAFYHDEEDLYKKIDYFRKNPQERMRVAKNGWKKYHELFNEQLIAKYITDLLFDEFDAKDYPWPTIVD